jgi:hypothetical protein
MKLLQIIFTNEGLPGIDRHIKEEIRLNDRKWFLAYVLTMVIFIGAYCLKEPKIIDNSPMVKSYCDSLQGYCDTANGIHILIENK